jgi:oligopeptide/dipeptide ABC transporter ATP-binding protein
LRSIPRLSRLDEPIRPIEGTVPEPIGLPAECRFYPRCSLGDAECRVDIPMRALAGDRMVRCIRAEG